MDRASTLRQLRRARSLSQDALAARAGLSQREVSGLELAQRRGRPGTWRRIAAALAVPEAWLGLSAAMDRGEIPFAKFGRARRIPKRALEESR